MPTPFSTSTAADGADEGSEQLPIRLIDTDLIDKLMSQALIDAGYCTNDEGVSVADYGALKAAVVQTMFEHHVVKDSKEMASRAVTKYELYAEMLPAAPGIHRLPESAEEVEAKNKLMTKVWGYTNTGTTGHVQAHVGESGLVVVEAQVKRTKVNQETRKTELTLEMGRFLTANRDLIMTHLTGPAGAKFVAQARKLENLLGMVTDRRPELALPVARQLSVVVKQAMSAIPHADVKQAAALTAGGRAADEETA